MFVLSTLKQNYLYFFMYLHSSTVKGHIFCFSLFNNTIRNPGYIASHDWMKVNNEMEKWMKVVVTILAFFCRGCKNPEKTSVTVLAEIQTGLLQNTSQEYHCLNQLAW